MTSGASPLTLLALVTLAQNPFWLQPPPPRPPEYPPIAVTAEEVAGLHSGGELVPLDVRGAEPFAQNHLPGAIRLRWPESCSNSDGPCLGRHLASLGISGNETLLLYGTATNFEEIGRAFLRLETAGCRDVRVLDGGISGWVAAGFELSRHREPRPPQEFLAPLARVTTATQDELWNRFGKRGTEVLDLRDDGSSWLQEYAEPERFAAGHVPHALPFDFRVLLTEGDHWPPPAEARATLLELGPRKGTRLDSQAEFLLYADRATSGRAGLGYLLMRMMDLPARVVTGGWESWRDEGRPTVRMIDADAVKKILAVENPGLRQDRATPSALLIDLREDWDFAMNHLPGAICLSELAFAQGGKELAKAVAAHRGPRTGFDLPLIFYCYGRDCVRSRNAASFVARAGYRDLLWFHDGYPEWRQLDLPVFPPPGSVKPKSRGARKDH